MLCPPPLEEKAELEEDPSTWEVHTSLCSVTERRGSRVTGFRAQPGPALGNSQDDASCLSQRVPPAHNFH